MEADSKNTQKRKRGRPRTINQAYFGVVSSERTERYKTRRARENKAYELQAFKVLMEKWESGEEKYGWFFTGAGHHRGAGTRTGILAELGRLLVEDEGMFWKGVEWVLENKPKTKQAITVLRRYRTGEYEPADAEQLFWELSAVVDDYRLRHPDLTTDQVREALGVLMPEDEE